jgi:hypothetical protein
MVVMKNESASSRTRHKLRLQAVAFLLIVLPSLGLYPAAISGITFATWSLMAIIAAAMILATIIS